MTWFSTISKQKHPQLIEIHISANTLVGMYCISSTRRPGYYLFQHSVGRDTIRGGWLFEGGPLNISAGAMGRVALYKDQEKAPWGVWPYAKIKRRCGSAKPHFLLAMAAVAPAATKLLVSFPKALTPARSFFNCQS